jgi:DNA-binding IclR family transcriptional regulator
MKLSGATQQGINSLETGVRLFQELHRLGRPATLSELSKISRMSPAKVHRYCVSLSRTGLMQQDARGLYGVGPYGFQFGHRQTDLQMARQIAFDTLPMLVHEIRETAFVSGWGQSGPIILKVEDAPKPISIRPNWRGDLPLWNSATGRVFAAFLPADRLERLMQVEFATQRRVEKLGAAEIIRRRRDFERQIAETRKHGVARTTGERYPGLISFAAPIFDHDGNVILAMTSFGLAAASFSEKWDGPVPRALKVFATDLTARIGGKASG